MLRDELLPKLRPHQLVASRCRSGRRVHLGQQRVGVELGDLLGHGQQRPEAATAPAGPGYFLLSRLVLEDVFGERCTTRAS